MPLQNTSKELMVKLDAIGQPDLTYLGVVPQSNSLVNLLKISFPKQFAAILDSTGISKFGYPVLYIETPIGTKIRYTPQKSEWIVFDDVTGIFNVSVLFDHQVTSTEGILTCTLSIIADYDSLTTSDASNNEITTAAMAIRNSLPFTIRIVKSAYTSSPDTITGEVDTLSTFDTRLSNLDNPQSGRVTKNEKDIQVLNTVASAYGARITANETGIANLVERTDAASGRLDQVEPKLESVVEQASTNAERIQAEHDAFVDFKDKDYSNVKSMVQSHESSISNNLKLITDLTATVDKDRGEAKSYTDQKIAEVVNGAPETLDTLKELAEALTENNGDTAQALKDIASNKTQLAALEKTQDDHEARILKSDGETKKNAEEITALKSANETEIKRLETAEATLTSHTEQLAEHSTAHQSLEEDHANSKNRITSLEKSASDHEERIVLNAEKIQDLITHGLSTEASEAANKRMDGLDSKLATKAEQAEVDELLERMLDVETVNTSQTADITKLKTYLGKEVADLAATDSKIDERVGVLETGKANNTLYKLPSTISPNTVNVEIANIHNLSASSPDGVLEIAASYLDLKPKGSSADYTLRLNVPTSGSNTLTFSNTGVVSTATVQVFTSQVVVGLPRNKNIKYKIAKTSGARLTVQIVAYELIAEGVINATSEPSGLMDRIIDRDDSTSGSFDLELMTYGGKTYYSTSSSCGVAYESSYASGSYGGTRIWIKATTSAPVFLIRENL